MLGLSHTPVSAAVMYYRTDRGSQDKCHLHPDDIAGVVVSHPLAPEPEPGPCVFAAPNPQWAPFCPEPDDDGCGAGISGRFGGGWPLWVVLALGWASGAVRAWFGRSLSATLPRC